MTKEQIKQGLECCACLHKEGCTKCAYLELKNENYACTIELAKDTLHYINTLKQEIKQLKGIKNE